jgi:hypothetical protein
MPKTHLLRIDRPLLEFAALLAAVRQAGLKAGYLEWRPEGEPQAVDPADTIAAAAQLDLLRAVRVDRGPTRVLKPHRGKLLLVDVLKEHFRGASLVLVDGAVDAPLLRPLDGSFQVESIDAAHLYTCSALVAALSKPRPF